MKQQIGRAIDVVKANAPVEGCTVSQPLWQEAGYSLSNFSLAAGTSISAETYAYEKLIYVWGGTLDVFSPDKAGPVLTAGDAIVTARDATVGARTESGVVYTELSLRKDSTMDMHIEVGKAFKLGELVPYRKGQIVNRDVIADSHLKFVVMSFDAGTGLAEHAAPGDALVMALDGEGVIGYEGEEHVLHAGESFAFAKGGEHYVKAADSRFKMALLVTLA